MQDDTLDPSIYTNFSHTDIILSEEEDDPEAFMMMLQDKHLNPSLSWEAQRDLLLDDDRFLAVDSDRKRYRLFEQWKAEGQTVINNCDAYLDLVRRRYKPDRFYLEFKRKYGKESGFAKSMLSDQEKERIYREYGRLSKKPEQERTSLLKNMESDDPVRLIFSQALRANSKV